MPRSSRFAKLSVPHIARIVPRPGLFRRLDASCRHRVLWIVAPPGAGKTALVASWLASRKLARLWIQLDPGDGDVATFFHYLALAAGGSGRHQGGLPVFTPEYLAGPGGFARRFFRALCAGARPPAVIVLDDYHEVRLDSPLHAALREGLSELPEGIAAVVMSRSEPPAAMARLQANGALEILRGEELALSEREASAVAALWGCSKGDREIVLALRARTEGWAAGLVLLLAAWRAGQHRRSEERALFDYFADEVLGRADQDARAVLLETALLPRVTRSMAVRLTGVAHAGEILSGLSRRGCFVVRHDTDVPFYQYHALLREFLLESAEKTLSPERLSELRTSAAGLLEESGHAEDAFRLYVQAQAWAGASRIVLANAASLLREGRVETVARWVLGLPEEVRERDPWLSFWLGSALSPVDPGGARRHLERAFDLFRESGDSAGLHLAWAAAADTYFFELDDLAPVDRWISILEELGTRFAERPGPESEARLATAALGALMNRQPWHAALPHWEERALSLALSPGDASHRFMAGRALAVYHGWWAMDLAKARLLVDALRPFATGKRADPATAIFWQIADANHHLHLARADACREAVDRGFAISAESGFRLWDPFLLALRCWAEVMTGDLAAAGRVLEQMSGMGERAPRLSLCAYHYAASVVVRRRGDAAAAREHGRISVELAVAGGMPLAEASCRLAWALAEPPEMVEAALEQALGQARRCGTRIVQVASLLGLALAAMRRKQDRRAVELLREGFAVARRLGNLHVFWLEPGELADCCALALGNGIEPEYVAQLIRAQRLAPGERARALDTWPWELRIEALGGFAVTKDGERLQPGRKAQKKPLEMLRLLVVQGPRGMRQDLLAGALWPDGDLDAAHHALETTVYRLRKLLGKGEAVIQQGGRIAADPRVVFVDAWALEQLLDQAEAARSGNGVSAASTPEKIRALVKKLYRGDLFEGEVDEPRVAAARERLRRRVERWLEPT